MRVAILLCFLQLSVRCAQPFPPQATAVQLWPCAAGSARQAWSVHSGPSPYAVIKLGGGGGQPDSGLVLNTLGYVNSSGGTLNVWTFAPDTPWGQQWELDAARGEVRSLTNGLCAGTANASAGQPLPAGTAVVQVPCSGVAEARWTLDAATAHLVWAGDASLCLDAGTTASCADPPLSSLPYCDNALPADARVADLVPRLQPVEAAALLSVSNNGVPRLGIPPLRFGEALHGVLSGCGAPHTDPASGYSSSGCPTSFPTGLALGATFNRSLWAAIGKVIGTEARALFNQGYIAQSVLFTPDINPFRDPRWGRGMEVSSVLRPASGEGGPPPP